MNKIIFSTVLTILLTCCSVVAQKQTTVSPATFKTLIGCWKGTLHYSGTMIRKPYTTTAYLIVKQTDTSSAFEFIHVYPQEEPDERVADTIAISEDGSKLNGITITSSKYNSVGSLELISEERGFDNDSNKAAVIRQTYTIGKQTYTYKKQVQPAGQKEWQDRLEFTYTRTSCTDEK